MDSSEAEMTDIRTLVRQRTVRGLAVLGLIGGAAIVTTACARDTVQAAAPATAAASGASGVLPVAVNCGPGQQALIRPALVSGQAISQVECVAVAASAASPVPASVAMPVSDVETIRVAERPAYSEAARPAAYRTASADRIVYAPERRVVRDG